jgi:hypothetical protein
MDASQAMRIVPVDPQIEFPWADGVVNRAVAIPLDEIMKYQGTRTYDVKKPRYVALYFDLVNDRRYPNLLAFAKDGGITGRCGVAGLVMTIGVAMRQDPKGVLSQRGTPLTAVDVCDFWRLDRDEARAIERSVAAATRAQFLTTVDVNDPKTMEAYAEKAEESYRRSVHTCTRVAVDRSIDRSTTTTTKREEKPEEPKEEMPPPPETAVSWRFAAAEIRNTIRDKRRRQHPPHHTEWPALGNVRDGYDLEIAVRSAMATDRMEDLRQCLLVAATWAEDGRGFRIALQQGGFIRSAMQ